MYYSVLTPIGTAPFKRVTTREVAPGLPLQVSEEATLIEFPNQPTQLFAQRWAFAYNFVLWDVNQVKIDDDDYQNRVIIETIQEFREYINPNSPDMADFATDTAMAATETEDTDEGA